MTDRERRTPESDETVIFSGAVPPPSRRGPPPPTATIRMPPPGARPPGPRRQIVILLLALLLGLGGGFAIAQVLGSGDGDRIPDDGLVLYESASTSFPIEGAAFTQSTFDAQKRKCDKEVLKRLLREDPRRFNAWLDLQEIQEGDFDDFIDSLETRILTKATPVTNYGCFPDGEGPCPFAIQSVLGPGTPVWFDPIGNRIVAKCTCSNPIRSPECPPNCEEIPTPTPTPSPTPSPTAPPPTAPPRTAAPTPPPTRAPTPEPTRPPTPSPQPTATPVATSSP